MKHFLKGFDESSLYLKDLSYVASMKIDKLVVFRHTCHNNKSFLKEILLFLKLHFFYYISSVFPQN